MLITFKTPAAPDVMMLENLAEYLLGIIGKQLTERGVITHDELPTAIEKLEAAVVVDKRKSAPSTTVTSMRASKDTSPARDSHRACAARLSVSRHAAPRTQGKHGHSLGRVSFTALRSRPRMKKPASSPMRVFSSYQYS